MIEILATPNPNVMASANGTAHLTYFDTDTQLSFVWDGNPESRMEVSHGGYAEPVIYRLPMSKAEWTNVPSNDPFIRFRYTCDLIAMLHDRGMIEDDMENGFFTVRVEN